MSERTKEERREVALEKRGKKTDIEGGIETTLQRESW